MFSHWLSDCFDKWTFSAIEHRIAHTGTEIYSATKSVTSISFTLDYSTLKMEFDSASCPRKVVTIVLSYVCYIDRWRVVEIEHTRMSL